MIRVAVSVSVATITCLGLFLLHACLSNPPQPDPDPLHVEGEVEVLVLLDWPASGVELTFDAPVKITSESGAAPVTLPAGTQSVRATGSGVRMGAAEFEGRWVRLEFKSERFTIRGRTREDKERSGEYRGDLQIHQGGGAGIFVNRVGLESYLLGVVGREMKLQPDLTEALKAQVIAARTYALYERSLERGGPFQLFADERSQMYGGVAAENGLARAVVEATRGLVVQYQGRVVPAYYSSTCGGATEPAWRMLRSAPRMPPLRGTPCGFCEESPAYEWSVKIGRGEMAEALFGIEGWVRKVEIVEKAPGGHALTVRVQMDGQREPKDFAANVGFRHKLGTHRFKSTLITEIVDAGKGVIEFRGRGWGHASGMCQWGAYGQARAGRTAFEILHHYFPGARVERLY